MKLSLEKFEGEWIGIGTSPGSVRMKEEKRREEERSSAAKL
jgi:hypothetical protein